MWRWEDVREGVKMRRCERRCEEEQMWEKMWRWADVKMSRCEDEQMWRWADVREDVKMSRCEDEQMWRWEGVKMRRCEDEKMWRWEDVKMSRCEDGKVWRWEGVREGVKMRRWDTDPHYWKNPALRRSRELWKKTILQIECLPGNYSRYRSMKKHRRKGRVRNNRRKRGDKGRG